MELAVVILAAGAGSRLGGKAKALLELGGSTFLEMIIKVTSEASVSDFTLVVGAPHEEAVTAEASLFDSVRIVRNGDTARGMASSIALGFEALLRDASPTVEAAFLWPVDIPLVKGRTLTDLQLGLIDHEVARPRFQGKGGHPPLIGRGVWPKLARCDLGEGGARAVLAACKVAEIEVNDPGILRSIDTPEDLAALASDSARA